MKKILSAFLSICFSVTLLAFPASAANTSKKLIALTFDDGPSVNTDRLLDALAENKAHATFFVSGYRLQEYSDELNRIVSEGHEVGNHTQNHKNLTTLSIQELASEVNTEIEILRSVGGETRYLLRPVGGAYNQDVRNAARAPLINWSLDTLDWKSRNADSVYANLMTAKDGDIILMHDLYKTTVEAVVRALPELKAQGFEMVTVTELFRRKGITLENGQLYTSARKYDTLPEISDTALNVKLPSTAQTIAASSDGVKGYASNFTAQTWKNTLSKGALYVTSPIGNVIISPEAAKLSDKLSASAPIAVRIAPDAGYTRFSVTVNGSSISEVPGGLRVILQSNGLTGSSNLTSSSIVAIRHPGVADTSCSFSMPINNKTICARINGYGSVRIVQNKALTFNDTPDWGKNAINFVSSHGLFTGVSSDMFAPSTPLSRGMIVTVLYRMSGEPIVKNVTKNFKDVRQDMYYSVPIAWAFEKGYVQGMGNNIFAPDINLTHEQLLQMLYNYAGYPAVSSDAASNAPCDQWAKNAYTWAEKAGIITKDDSTWRLPAHPISRGETAILLYRYVAYTLQTVK